MRERDEEYYVKLGGIHLLRSQIFWDFGPPPPPPLVRFLGCIRAPPKRPKAVVLAKMQKLHHLKQISELNTPVGVIFNGNA